MARKVRAHSGFSSWENEETFRLLFSNHPMPMGIINVESLAFLEVNGAMAELYGYTDEEFQNLALQDVHPLEDTDRLLSYVSQQPTTLQRAGEYRHRLKDGSFIDVEVNLQILNFTASQSMLMAVQDITARRHTETTLHESEDRYRSLFDRMMDGIYRSTHTGRFVDVNPAMVEMFGFASREEMLAVDIKKELYFAPSERGSHILDTGQEETEVYRMRRKDGSEIWVEDHGYYVHDSQGDIIYHEGMLRDVTERKHAEEALHQQFANLNSLYEMTAILSQTTAVDEVYETALDGLQKTLGTERVSILLFDADGVMRFKAWRGLSEHYRKTVEGHSPWAQGARDPQPLLVPDVHIEPSLGHLLPVLGAEGIGAVAFIPLTYQDELLGKFMIYYAASHVFSTDEIQLAQTISRHVGLAIARKQAEEELRYANKSLESAHRELQQMFMHEQILARTDGLTGLYNRRYFFELATREFSAAIRYDRPLTIILFDVDGFKHANDTFGHAMGDTILAQIAQAAASQVRDVDVLARYGGDEFIVLLPQTTVQAAYHVAERIREQVCMARVEAENGLLAVTISVGVAEMINNPQDLSVEDAIRRADQALYSSKAKGHNQTVIFRASVQDPSE